jgi:hypothetical protein
MSVPLYQTKFFVACDVFDGNAVISEGSFAGNDYHIVPSVMLVEGAFTPAIDSYPEPTSLYFDGADIMDSVHSWNGRPVSLYHPIGDNSCNVPHVLDNQLIGYVFNARFEAVGKKLKADLWLLKDRGKFIVDKILKGDKIELSVGAFGDIVPEIGTSNGVGYSQRMTNIVGDHLAVLPDVGGACSWSDGCGIRMEDGKAKVTAIRTISRKPSYSDVEKTSWGDVSKSLENYLEGYYKLSRALKPEDAPKDVSEMSSAAKRWISSKTLLGDAKAKDSDNLIFFPVVNPLTNKLNEGALRAVLSGRGAQAKISGGAKSSAQSMAESLLNSEFGKKETKMEEKVEQVSIKACEKKVDKVVTMEDVLDSAPEDIRGAIQDAMVEREEQRKSLISAINACDKASFCPKFLAGAATKDLREISSLVEASKEEKKEKVVVSNVDYSLRPGMEVSDKKRCEAPSLF